MTHLANNFNTTVQPLFLQPHHMPAFHALQGQVIAALPAAKKHFLKPRDLASLYNHVGGCMPALGVLDKTDTLVAGALVTYPHHDDAANVAEYPVHGAAATTAIIQSLMVAPTHKGLGLSAALLESAEMVAAQHGYTQLMAKVSVLNTASQHIFQSAGFKPFRAPFFDAKGGYEAQFWVKQVGHVQNKPMQALKAA